jgi:hypothetical protein
MKEIKCFEDMNGNIHRTEEECRSADKDFALNLSLRNLVSDRIEFQDIELGLFIKDHAHVIYNMLKTYLGVDNKSNEWTPITEMTDLPMHENMMLAVYREEMGDSAITKGYYDGSEWRYSSDDEFVEYPVVAFKEIENV